MRFRLKDMLYILKKLVSNIITYPFCESNEQLTNVLIVCREAEGRAHEKDPI